MAFSEIDIVADWVYSKGDGYVTNSCTVLYYSKAGQSKMKVVQPPSDCFSNW
jgi:hypothetical protein